MGMDATAKSPENCNFIQYSTWRKGIVKWKSGMARPEEDAFGGRDGWVTHVVTLTDAETPIRLLGAVPIDGSREQQGDGQPREIELHGHMLGHRATPGRVAMAAAARVPCTAEDDAEARGVRAPDPASARWVVTLARTGRLCRPALDQSKSWRACRCPQARRCSAIRPCCPSGRHHGESLPPLPPDHYEVQEHEVMSWTSARSSPPSTPSAFAPPS